jgi:hypothetical protein
VSDEKLGRERMEIAAYVLQEIAGWDGDGGADPDALPRLVDRRRSVEPDDDEVDGALALLEERGLVVRVADRYVLSPTMRLRAPKGPDGRIAMSRQAWIRLFGSLGLTESGA